MFKHLKNFSIVELVEKFKSTNNQKLICFDTETLGFTSKHQITQVAGLLISFENIFDFQTHKISKIFNQSADLTPRTLYRLDYKPQEPVDYPLYDDILKMTNYNSTKAKGTEDEVLNSFYKFCNNINDGIYVAHNSKFDFRMLNERSSLYEINKLPNKDIIDTLYLSRLFLIPAIKTAKENTNLYCLGQKIKKGAKYSSKLGVLAEGFNLDTTGWHDAKYDSYMTYQVLVNIINLLNDFDQYNLLEAENLSLEERSK